MTHHIFLSPHLDDVPLSCGGTLASLVDTQAEIKVITIFAGIPSPSDPVSDFANYQHQMWGNPQQAYHIRRAEDMTALAYFGLKPIWLDFFDCIYRGQPDEGKWYYNSDEDIFGLIHPAELDTVGPIVGTIAALIRSEEKPGGTIVYAPLTVGNHVDHQLTFLAALHLLRLGCKIYFYEEYPYADRDSAYLAKALNETTPTLLRKTTDFANKLAHPPKKSLWQSTIKRFSPSALELKIKAIAAYETQLEVLFGGEETMVQRVTGYAYQVGQGEPGERFWLLNL